jgi:uncharacterized membrane protein
VKVVLRDLAVLIVALAGLAVGVLALLAGFDQFIGQL